MIISKLGKQFLLKPLSLFLIFSFLFFNFIGCSGGSSSSESLPPIVNDNDPPSTEISQVAYGGGKQVANVDTDSGGKAKITTNSLSAEYDIQVVDQNGNPIPGLAIDYFEIAGQSVIHIFDPNSQYTDAFIMGSPVDIESNLDSQPLSVQYNNVQILNKKIISKSEITNENAVRPKVLLFTAVALIVTVASIAMAEINYTINAYEVATFYITDNALSGDGWQINCKTWDQIAGLISNRLDAALNLSSILVSFVGAAGGIQGPGASIMFDIGTYGLDSIRNTLLEQAIDDWGESMTTLQSRSMAVQIFEPEEGMFENLRKMFATYLIHEDHPICRPMGGALTGTIVDASTAEPLSGVTVSIDAGTQTTTTNSEGQYSFNSISLGYHDLTASRSGYIPITKEIDVSGEGSILVNFALSETILDSDKYRVVLSWGLTPSDLDSHMWTPDGSHIYFSSVGSETVSPYTQLDVDDTTSYGPETITVFYAQPGSYRYSVYNFSEGSSTVLSDSEATVRLFGQSGLIREWNVPYGHGYWWNVFAIDGNTGQVTDINEIGNANQ